MDVTTPMPIEVTSVTAAFTLAEWCVVNRVSRGTFYNLQKEGKAPRIMRAGSKILITPEANDDWRRAREADAQAEVAA